MSRTTGSDTGQRRKTLREQGLTAAVGLEFERTATFGLGHDLAVPVSPGIYIISDLRGRCM